MGTRVKTNLKGDDRPRHFIRQWRKHRGLTQEQLASRLDVAVSSISQLENGKQGYSQPMLEAIADALNCEPADLLMRDPTMKSAIWSIQDQLAKAPPERQQEILNVVAVLLGRTG
jgi:transcriptional regulator with XRE-family HTH domain